jgi:hypothetical protein
MSGQAETASMTREELMERIDDCRRRILAEFGIECGLGEALADEPMAASAPSGVGTGR